VPSANEYVCAFLARAVVDEVLPPSFLSDPLVRSIGGSVINDAMRLLSREHCSVRLERVWGPGDGRPVADLKIAMDQLLKEFLLSHELDEAAVCVKEVRLDEERRQQAYVALYHKLTHHTRRFAHRSSTPPTSTTNLSRGGSRLLWVEKTTTSLR